MSFKSGLALTWLALVSVGPPLIYHYGEHQRELGGSVQGSRATEVVVEDEPIAHESHQEPAEARGAENLFGFPFDGWVAAFTATLTIATILLWRETERLARHGERDAIVQRRPWVSLQVVRGAGAVKVLEPRPGVFELAITYQVRNVGLTPAVNVSVQSSNAAPKFEDQWIENWKKIAADYRNNPRDFGWTLFPGPAGEHTDTINVAITPAIEPGESAGSLFVVMWVEYQFTDRKAHYTPISWAFMWERARDNSISIVEWRQHNKNALPD